VPAACVSIQHSRASQDPNLTPERTLATAAELTTIVATLDERVKNHIRFFWTAVAFGFLWLAALTGLIIHTSQSVDRVAKAQVDAAAQIGASRLDKPVPSSKDNR
jgi:hypothetical protein